MYIVTQVIRELRLAHLAGTQQLNEVMNSSGKRLINFAKQSVQRLATGWKAEGSEFQHR
jgi:hypothetical protein